MKIFFFILMFGSLFANENLDSDAIIITQESKVEVYTALFWAPCNEAKKLLRSRGIDFESKMVTFSRKKANEMKERSEGKTSVPQIFIDD